MESIGRWEYVHKSDGNWHFVRPRPTSTPAPTPTTTPNSTLTHTHASSPQCQAGMVKKKKKLKEKDPGLLLTAREDIALLERMSNQQIQKKLDKQKK